MRRSAYQQFKVPAGPDWLMTYSGLGSNPGQGVGFQLVGLRAGML